MKYFLLAFLFTLFLKADTDSVDTSDFDYGMITPMEFSYINTKDDGALYQAGIGFGASLEYNLLELEVLAMVMPYTHSDTLFYWDDYSEPYGDTIKYGGIFLYRLDSKWQIGADYFKYIFVTNNGKISEGTSYGEMSSYGVRVAYTPFTDILIKKNGVFSITLSLGYLNAPNITYEKKIKDYIGWDWEIQHIKKKYDLSGPIMTLGLIKKF